MKEFGEKLKTAREAKGYTQQTLADMIYTSRQTISRYENGERYPDLLTLKKLASILEVSIDFLLDNEELPKAVEKNHVIEKPIVKNIIIVLYGFIIITYMQLSINNVGAKAPMMDFEKNIEPFFGIQMFTEILEVVVFAYGFIMVIQDKLNPKRTGSVTISFLTLEIIKLIDYFLYGNIITPLILSIPYIIAIVATYCFYFKNNNKAIFKILIVLTSLFGILRETFTLYSMLLYADHLYSLSQSIAGLLVLLIYVLFIYQMLVLNNKRKLANKCN